MLKTAIKNGVGLLALAALSACAMQDRSERLAEERVDNEGLQCLPTETLACDRFADETYNCICESSSNMRDILDSY